MNIERVSQIISKVLKLQNSGATIVPDTTLDVDAARTLALLILVDRFPGLSEYLTPILGRDGILVRHFEPQSYESKSLSEAILQGLERDVWYAKVPVIFTAFVSHTDDEYKLSDVTRCWDSFTEEVSHRSPIIKSYIDYGHVVTAMGILNLATNRLLRGESHATHPIQSSPDQSSSTNLPAGMISIPSSVSRFVFSKLTTMRLRTRGCSIFNSRSDFK